MDLQPGDRAHRSADPNEAGLPGERAASLADIPPEYWRAFSIVAFAMNRFVIDQVIRASRLFDNDVEAMVIFGTLSHLNVAHLLPPGSAPSRTLGADGRYPQAQPRLRPVRLRDLVQITGRPRETIRRKLDKLHEQGRIVRVVDGWVIDAAAVDADMRAHSVDAVRRFMETAASMRAALSDAERTLAAEAAAASGKAAAPR